MLFTTPANHGSDEEDLQLNDVEFNELQKEEAIDSLNASLTDVGCSPLKLHALNESCKISYAQQKLEKLQQNVKKKIEIVLDVEVPQEGTKLEKTIMEQKAADMDLLVETIKNQLLPQLTSKKKVQLLTIPASLNWSRKKMKDTFQVSDYSVRQAQSLFKEKRFSC